MKIMLLVSQNITNYEFQIPESAVFRINLAWVNSINELEILLTKHHTREIFLDLPRNRTKPPNNKYSLSDLIQILNNNNNIKYFAISNIESESNLDEYIESIPKGITIVPKIESKKGIQNIDSIIKKLQYEKPIIMLDHDDLFSDLIKSNHPPETFSQHVNKLTKFCKENDVTLLRTIGIIFADENKDVSNYMR